MFVWSSLLQLFHGKILLFKIFWQRQQQCAAWFQLVASDLAFTRSGFLHHRFRICLSLRVCNHASWEHENLVGKRDEWGGFRTQQSAVYPDGLCETIVQIIRPLFPRCAPPLDASVAYLNDCVPKKGASDPPHSFQDGAGIYSVPDWSVPPATARRFASIPASVAQ